MVVKLLKAQKSEIIKLQLLRSAAWPLLPLQEEINSTVPDESHFLFIDPKRRRCSPAAHVSERL